MNHFIKSAFKTLWNAVVFRGNATKEEYTIYICFMVLFPVCTYILLYAGLSFSIISTNIAYSLITLSSMSIIIPFIALPALTVRRLNDAGKNKLLALFLLLPLFAPNSFKIILWLLILIIFARIGKVEKKQEKIIKYDK